MRHARPRLLPGRQRIAEREVRGADDDREAHHVLVVLDVEHLQTRGERCRAPG